MELREIQSKCYQLAKDKGWAEREIPIPEMIALIHSEASEALEAYRNNLPILPISNDPTVKSECLAMEFADILIRMCHYASILSFDLEAVTLMKLKYNETRPYRHGGKKA